jgi:hypothetical protein
VSNTVLSARLGLTFRQLLVMLKGKYDCQATAKIRTATAQTPWEQAVEASLRTVSATSPTQQLESNHLPGLLGHGLKHILKPPTNSSTQVTSISGATLTDEMELSIL